MVDVSRAPIAVIGGSGLYALVGVDARVEQVPTPYGAVELSWGELAGRRAVFLPRHGRDHSVPPHLINARASIWALAAAGVRAIISTAAVGTISSAHPIGSLTLVDQYIDRTHGRADTFFDTGSVQHLASADPFCPTLHRIAADALGDEAIRGGTVVVIQGPRFSTRAESTWFRAAGAHLVNMTLYPEVPLAAELGIGTVTLAFATDDDAAPGDDPVNAELVFARLAAAQPRIVAAIGTIAAAIPGDYTPRELLSPAAVAEVLGREPR
ncbi:MTAP family purine nucleoside phosphorylase [Protaetiibacter mangrovi]|uniref:S-methyl-5'-thioadenosine phosphorylase n=1 Tax=Protaetiibacter mangrovi TaxID=2970926 RepID=A0ABT1ZCB5_9MICO|nr:MTAP family purine nucleoside phosphorylase [Protaetiibacter mangrovi]MCS0498324.1 MTAP family purine nucleoside phosphorylase [Protaetiibacter mangrovi]TPX02380.1 MTAP family purine nucleoside phosphorylase [Schumannella luteola]